MTDYEKIEKLLKKFKLYKYDIENCLTELVEQKCYNISSHPTNLLVLRNLSDEINKLRDYASVFEKGVLKIKKITFKNSSTNLFLRLGFISENNKSYNYITKDYENGVSVFEIKNNLPVLENLQILDSFCGRKDFPAFLVTGDLVGVGFDGEPLLKNVSYVSKFENLDFKEITFNILNNNYKTRKNIKDYDEVTMHRFYDDELQDMIVTFCGFEFSNPKNNFDVRMGHDRI